MEQQFAVLGNRSFEWQDHIDPSRMQVLICGAPSNTLLRLATQIADAGISVNIMHPVAGFNRLATM